MSRRNIRLGDILVDSGLITKQELHHVLELQKKQGKKIGELLVEENIITERQIIEVLEFQLGIPHIDIKNYYINPDAPKKISENLARKYVMIPIDLSPGKIMVAMEDPLNLVAIDDVKLATGREVIAAISTKNGIMAAINKYYDNKELAEQAVEEFIVQQESSQPDEFDSRMQDEIDNAPVVKLVNTIISQAVKMKASDIHIEPFEKHVRIRYRIDGDLQEIMTPARNTHSAIVTRIKIISKLDISEKRLPQDGRVEIILENRPIDMRISILPTVYGEKIVIRLLDRKNVIIKKEQLGFTEKNLQLFDRIIKKPEGIILVTGPTGSGKTTTLYAILTELNKIQKNIITVEDPVEYRLDGINQVQVNLKAGMTFATGLRSILRQDPDIVMVGEIRDEETAEIAIRAAITGHLVLSTLHTNDTVSSIARLINMGVEPHLVSSAVTGVVAQRLVKKICTNCIRGYEASEQEMSLMGVNGPLTLYKGKGCNLCGNTGYSGRTAVHEVMAVSKEIRGLISRQADSDRLKDQAIEEGMVTLFQSCKILVLKGVTTVDELLRVAYNIDM